MKSGRERIFVVFLSLVLMVILEVITTNVLINYNLFTRVVSAILYYTLFIFIIIDGYYSIKCKSIYYKSLLIKDVSILMLIMLLLHFLTNIQTSNKIMIVIGLIVLTWMSVGFLKLAEKNSPYEDGRFFRR